MATFTPNEYVHDWSVYDTENTITVTTSADIETINLTVIAEVDYPHFCPECRITSKTRIGANTFRYGIYFTIRAYGFHFRNQRGNKDIGFFTTNGITIIINDGQALYKLSPDSPIFVTELAEEFRPQY